MGQTEAQQLQRRNRELSILNTVASALNSSVDLDEALRVTLAQVADLLQLQTGWVWLLDEVSGDSYLAQAQNLPPALASNPEKMAGSCYCLSTFADGDLDGAANVNVVECSRLHGLVDGTDGLRYHASIPLYAHGKKLGVLNVASRDWRALSADDLRLLYTVGDLLSIAVERARLYDNSAQQGAVAERSRLARELHDTLAQALTAITLQLESADALMDAGADTRRVQATLLEALQLARAGLDDVRRSVMDLRAATLQERTLIAALREMAEQSDVPATFTVTGGNRPLPPHVEAGLFRIAQEGLTNAQRHGQAQAIEMKLLLFQDQVRLVIADDGRGFDPGAVPGDRYGLVGLSERVHLLGGSLLLESGPGEGTHLRVTVPLLP